MRPVLFELGPVEVKSYGVFVALAFVAAWLVLRHELGRRAGRPDAATTLILAAALGGFVGARLYWYVENGGSAQPGTCCPPPASRGTAASWAVPPPC